ncbi:MAG: FAD-binding oxidoreductase [Acidobacteriota bacterium]
MNEAVDRHARKVARIAAALRAHDRSRPLSLRKKGVSHQVPKAKDLRHKDDKLDISDLDEILAIDPVARTCTAEAGVTFVDLVAATLAHGLVPIVVPELKTITIGGAVAGCSIESMSFVHGGFHDTCLEYEVIAATGDVLVCRPDNEHALVFQMIHGTFGTLGILARLTFKLVPAKRYVHLVHERYTTIADYQAAIARHAKDRDLDFMDGIIHSPSLYVLCCGRFVDEAPYTSRYDWLAVYFQSTAKRREDYLTTPDYFFRYDRGVTNVRPRSFVGRLLFGKLLNSTQWLWLGDKLHWLLRDEKPTVTLDVFVPASKVPAFLEWHTRELGHYPLWCVPYRRVRDYEWLADEFWAALPDDMFYDLAIYGMRQKGPRNAHRMVEDKLRELGGIKTLIAHNYYPEAEFWSIWNKRNYDAVKRLVDPNNLLRDLYTKTCKTVMGKA